ncbi:fluoride efflux transporter CrcB [Jiangella aurantiaca]|uniref:Fluoride-specific ion channel FluC n=1 Tax=Jiangella aurantiaca TaxID=2530373 RepID=A0A4R5A8T2_9ACTN|nr:fluoride efflux transporter CrcB [Jiangella aurantiaca]TDD67084.1 fluoride efflux transporter CrcB [Jiangella aurantiaca]
MTVLLVAAGAAVGAPLRYVVDRWVGIRLGAGFPWGTLVVNVVGSFVLGLVLGSPSVGAEATALIGTGFCGALTTYSTFSYETLRLLEDGAWSRGVANVLVSVAAGLGAAALGWTLAS